MKTYAVIFDDRAVRRLEEIADYIADRAGGRIASAFVARIEDECLSLADSPFRGTLRERLGRGVRTFGFERRATIAIRIDEDADAVVILDIFYAGRAVGGFDET